MNEVDYLVNDLSLHGQFHDVATFARAIDTLMKIRAEIILVGSALYCHRMLQHARVTPELLLPQAVRGLSIEKQRALMLWLGNQGPYWEDARLHTAEDYLAVDEGIVTETAIGEAAICISRGLPRELVSFSPSDWEKTPVVVDWVREVGETEQIPVPNHWEIGSVRASLERNPFVVDSWDNLEAHVRRSCAHLTFSEDAFHPMRGHPFVVAAVERIRVLLHTLNQFKTCFNEAGQRTPEGNRLIENHFGGEAGWFSDSSPTERREFENELTFRHPGRPGEYLFCPWHGKVQTPPFRIHFSWPVTHTEPLYVVYVGLKITRR